MTPMPSLRGVPRDAMRALRQWLDGWRRIIRLGAVILALALSPSSYRGENRAAMAREVYLGAAPLLLWFTVLSSLIGVVLIRIVVVTALSYGLSRYALEMVVRVLVLELIPMTAAIFVALRCTLPNGAQIAALRARGEFDALRRRGIDPLQREVLPRVTAGIFAVLLLAATSGVVALVLAYLSVHGFTVGALAGYTRTVGHVFSPPVTMIFALKTFFLSLAVSLIPVASALSVRSRARLRSSAELRGLVRMFLAILLIEAASLIGNYY